MTGRRIRITHNGTTSETATKNEEETLVFAEALAKELSGGSVLGLSGNLGAGKTTFVKGLARGLGVSDTVTSPTFVLMNVYPTEKKDVRQFVHIDCYRLEQARELSSIGALDYIGDAHTVVAIEWAEHAKKILPSDAIWIEFMVTDYA